MKRSRLRHRSRKNSRYWEDEQLRADYLEANPLCELAEHLPIGYVPGMPACEVHHICHASRRWDKWPNFVSVSRPAHDFVHDNPASGTIACFYVKWIKGEFTQVDRAVIREIWGQCPIAWIERHEDVPEWAGDMRLLLLEGH